MHTMPALTNPFKLNRYIAILTVATFVTFALFVAMHHLIKNDQISVTKATPYSPIVLTYDIKEKPPTERPKIKPQPEPLPKPKLIEKVMESEPDTGFDSTLLVSNFAAPVIRNTIKPNFGTGDGDARPIVRVEPKYPTVAARDGIEGWVKLSFSITASGTVNNIQVIDAEPKRMFNQAARRALAKWKYKPNIQAGKAQAQDGMMVMLDFKLAS